MYFLICHLCPSYFCHIWKNWVSTNSSTYNPLNAFVIPSNYITVKNKLSQHRSSSVYVELLKIVHILRARELDFYIYIVDVLSIQKEQSYKYFSWVNWNKKCAGCSRTAFSQSQLIFWFSAEERVFPLHSHLQN